MVWHTDEPTAECSVICLGWGIWVCIHVKLSPMSMIFLTLVVLFALWTHTRTHVQTEEAHRRWHELVFWVLFTKLLGCDHGTFKVDCQSRDNKRSYLRVRVRITSVMHDNWASSERICKKAADLELSFYKPQNSFGFVQATLSTQLKLEKINVLKIMRIKLSYFYSW